MEDGNEMNTLIYKGEELKILPHSGENENILIVEYKNQRRMYRKDTKEIVNGDNKLIKREFGRYRGIYR